jgi:uncharacterized phage protein (TIGR01671 family)
MNERFKFRVWDKGNSIFLSNGKNAHAITNLGKLVINKSSEWYGGMENTNPNDYVIQQYTGLKDKNDKDIYEGDIIKRTMEIGPHCSYPDFKLSDAQKVGLGEVKWDSYSDGEYADAIECYMLDNDSLSELIYRTKRDYQQYIHTYEVVGNIFENADLLN